MSKLSSIDLLENIYSKLDKEITDNPNKNQYSFELEYSEINVKLPSMDIQTQLFNYYSYRGFDVLFADNPVKRTQEIKLTRK